MCDSWTGVCSSSRQSSCLRFRSAVCGWFPLRHVPPPLQRQMHCWAPDPQRPLPPEHISVYKGSCLKKKPAFPFCGGKKLGRNGDSEPFICPTVLLPGPLPKKNLKGGWFGSRQAPPPTLLPAPGPRWCLAGSCQWLGLPFPRSDGPSPFLPL